ncbi:MAG: LytTR family DNA-binding domain-containing protein [Thiotrichaceae bacterium]|nr:LytTR family DNA-binding domain-containing protein [Thiotrichaceae bacterium]
MKILIVDDERLARERLTALVHELGLGKVVGEASNGKEALSAVHAYQPDVVLLDIRMPGMDGMQVAQRLVDLYPQPIVIFTTAYNDHALEAFETQAVDYLVKPIRKDRLQQALKRAQALLQKPQVAEDTPRATARSHISINVRSNLKLIPVGEIFYFSADEKYVILHWKEGEALLSETLKDLEKEFAGQFLRIHRSTLVAINYISSLVKDNNGRCYITLRDQPTRLEISRRHLPTVRKVLKDMRLSSF